MILTLPTICSLLTPSEKKLMGEMETIVAFDFEFNCCFSWGSKDALLFSAPQLPYIYIFCPGHYGIIIIISFKGNF